MHILQGCDLVIALTHMRSVNDIRLGEHAVGIDLILGGHDHVYEVRYVSYLLQFSSA
jgi:5'-nucleotidase